MTIEQADVDAKRLGNRLVLDAEEIHRASDPYGVIVHTQRLAYEAVRAYAAEHGMDILTARITWECRIEAVAE